MCPLLSSPVGWWRRGPTVLVFSALSVSQSVSLRASHQHGGAELLDLSQLVAETREKVGPAGGMWVGLCLSLILLHSCQAYLQDGKRTQPAPTDRVTYGG